MPRAFFKNIATVALQDKAPGMPFQVEVFDDGTPVDGYWRKRLNEGAIAPFDPRSAPADSPASQSPASSEAAKKTSSKKGA